jgi:spore germination protein KC
MIIRRASLCIILSLPLLSLSGCWDKKELNQVAVVIGVGLDKGKGNQVKVTAQVIKPTAGQQQGKGGSELPTWSLSASGRTVMDAIAQLNRISPRRLYWPHLQIIVLGEDLAKQGVAPYLTWFERDRESRAGAFMVVTRGKAEDLLNKKIELGNVPALAIAEFLDTSDLREITARRMKLREFVMILTTPGIDPAMDVIDPKEIRGKVETYRLAGTAVFRGDKLKGFITNPVRMGIEIFFDKYKYAVLNASCPGSNDKFITFQVTDLNKQTQLNIKGENIAVKLKVSAEGNLADQSCFKDLLDPEMIDRVETQVSQEIERYVRQSFKEAAAMKADIFGIGRELRRYHPDVWHRKQQDWASMLSKVDWDIQVETNIRRSGLILEPTPAKMK